VLGLAACVGSGDETVMILVNQEPGVGCVLDAEEGGTAITAGIIDARSSSGYLFSPLVKNYATAVDADEERRHQAFVQGARVTIHFNDESLEGEFEESLTRFQVPFSGIVMPGGTAQFTFEIVPIEIIDAIGESLPEAMPGEAVQTELLLVDVQMFGEINNGSFETQSYRYPVEICNGCLVQDLGACSNLSSSFTTSNTGGHCNLAQDRALDCCDDFAVCPAVGTGL
jgi:hypothetical protein